MLMEITGCMKQHLMIFFPNSQITALRVENICVIACHAYNSNSMNVSRSKMHLTLIFLKIWKSLSMRNATNTSIKINNFFASAMYHHFVSLFTGNPAEPLFFVKVTEMRTKNYLKLTRSRSLNNKKFQILPACVLLPLDDAYDTYVEIDNDLQLNINIYNALVAKAHI